MIIILTRNDESPQLASCIILVYNGFFFICIELEKWEQEMNGNSEISEERQGNYYWDYNQKDRHGQVLSLIINTLDRSLARTYPERKNLQKLDVSVFRNLVFIINVITFYLFYSIFSRLKYLNIPPPQPLLYFESEMVVKKNCFHIGSWPCYLYNTQVGIRIMFCCFHSFITFQITVELS